MSHPPLSTSSKSNGVQFLTKYEQLRHQEQNRLEFEQAGGGGGGGQNTTVIGAPAAVVINMGDSAVLDIPMTETRARKGSSAASLKMHDDEDDDSDEEEDEENAQEYKIRKQQAKK